VSLQVSPVTSRRERSEFIELPFRLHANERQWVPPLRIERRFFLSSRFNAYFKHADAQLFLARRGGRMVGRISAQIDHAFNDYHASNTGMFGFLELEEDPEVLEAMLAAVAAWLRARGCDRMVGPMDFTMNDEVGVLYEGFERQPLVKQPWHPPYYQRLCEAASLEKAIDLWMWELVIADRARILPILFELAEKLEPDHGIRIRHMRRRTLRRDLEVFREIYNDAWKRNWGFVPYSQEDIDAYAQELHLVFDPAWFMVAETAEGKAVGAAITVPDINQVLKRMNGRLLPLGWWHFLRRRRIIDRCRVGFLGVRREYQHTGVAAGLYIEHFDAAAHHRVKWGEMGWILETNKSMNRGMEAMGGRIVKRYRVYEREIA
jgi:hypothetical protein